MSNTLKKKTLLAIFWTTFERIGYQGVRALVTLILARLLSPNDFGIIGILLVFIAICEAIINNGFSQAIIQKKEIDEDDLTTAFYLSLLFSIFLYILLFFSSVLIAGFYNEPTLVSLNRILGFVIIIDSLVVIQMAVLQREMDFKSISIITMISSLISGIIGIAMGFAGLGVWSLVAQMLGQKLFMAISLWIKSGWYPRGRICRKSFLHLFDYGWKLQVAGFLNQSFRHVNSLIIGKFFSIELVGYYTQAKNLKNLPTMTLSSIVSKVTFPAFSQIRDDSKALKRGYRTSLQLLVFFIFPLMFGLVATAERLIPILLGNQWIPSIKMFQLLCISAMLYPLQTSNVNIIKVKGKTDYFLYLEILKKAISISIIIITVRWGIYPLIIGQIVSSYISLVLNASVAGRLINYKMFEQIKDCLPSLINSFFMAVIVRIIGIVLIGVNDIFLVTVQILVGIFTYVLINIVSKNSTYYKALSLITVWRKNG